MFNLSLATIISRTVTLLIAFSVHEFAHAYTADIFGDETPRMHGRLTLNPMAHLDVLGTLMLLFAGFGWAKPVPINPYNLRRHSPAALMWVSLAGPLSNFLLALMAAIPMRFGLVNFSFTISSTLLPTLSELFSSFFIINLVLFLFNLIPIAPLDGEKIADYFFPPAWARTLQTIRPYGPLILMLVIFVAPRFGIDILGWIITPVLIGLTRLLIGI